MTPGLGKISSKYFEALKHSKSDSKKYVLLYESLKDLILFDELPKDFILPPTRLLSKDLKLSRSTVLKAYDMLKMENMIEAIQGSGHRVLREEPTTKVQHNYTDDHYPDPSALGKSYLKNITLINSTEDKSIAFRPGLPPLDIFPVNLWKQLSNAYWRGINLSGLSYSSTTGIIPLKENISNYLKLTRGVQCDPEQVIIVSGSLQSLYLLATIFIDAGDTAVMEEPTFPNVHSILRSSMANTIAVPLDDEGISIRGLNSISELSPKLLHLTPSYHYPSGTIMSKDRRLEVLNWANKNKCLIIENDYEHELNNWDKSEPSLFTLDQEERVIYLGTFNRLLHPSLRIGYMVVPHYIRRSVEALMRHSHRFVSPSIQIVLNQFIEKRHLYRHIQNLAEVVQTRSEVFRTSFLNNFGEQWKLDQPEAMGLQFLIRRKTKSPDKEWIRDLEQKNIISHSYNKCFVNPSSEQGLIMGYSSVRTPVIQQKLKQMAKIEL